MKPAALKIAITPDILWTEPVQAILG